MKLWTSFGSGVQRYRQSGKRLVLSVSKPVYVALVLILSFGISAVGHAAQKVKRRVRNTKTALKSSYAGYMVSKAWSYFKPSWEFPELKDPNTANDTLYNVVNDPDDRLEKPFRPSSRLKGRVRFWVDVYARYNSQYRIVHDRENPERVYGVIDMRPLYRAFPARIAQAKAYQIEKNVLKALKAKLSEAAEVSKSKNPTLAPQEKESIRKMLSQYGAGDPEKAAVYIARVRTQTGQQDHFIRAIGRSQKLLPQIEKIFKEKGLPIALTRLPFVETSFNPKAISKTGALGMWQFMPDTARLFDPKGTRRDWADPLRQSRNAARMLSILYNKLGDWGIAVTGYNSGGARLARIAQKHRVDNIDELLEVPASKDTLGFAGRNFYAELVAANLVIAYQEKIFSQKEMHLSRIGVSRRVQSLLEAVMVTKADNSDQQQTQDRAPQSVKAKKHKKSKASRISRLMRHRSAKKHRVAHSKHRRVSVKGKHHAQHKSRRGTRATKRA